ncbi:multicopper oxidase [Gigaspora margarita]|uniref:Multicopper oxidase n=1 Tax=Gigaspora margarita TaxID=4874 RepID=A0A8H4EM11_GIGMA|nr:multicopper oxidase [Gigaspora margarita]
MYSLKILALVFILIGSFLLLLPNESLSSPFSLSDPSSYTNFLEKRYSEHHEFYEYHEFHDSNEYHEKSYNIKITKEPYAPDGFKRDIYLVNGQFPGPLIECNKGDVLVINVENCLNEDTTIHSHGIFQRDSPWYDGVPGQTQGGIPSNETFTYKFKVDQSGTYWYHSHSRAQYIEGLLGPLIVHDPQDPYLHEYDEEIIVILQDWYHTDSKTLLATFLTPESEGNEPDPDNGLINGKNSYNCSWAPNGSKCDSDAPLANFKLVYGKRYRFRIINTSAFATFIFSIDDHPLDVIEVEGMMTKRHTVHRLPINIAQRYSVIVKADKPKKKYWMRSEMESACFAAPATNLNPLIKAIVEYEGCDNKDPSSTAWSDDVENCVDLNVTDLKPYKPQNVPKVDRKIEITINFKPDENNVTMGYINNSTYKIDIKNPTLYKVYDDVKTFDTDQNAFILEKDCEVIDIILKNEDGGEHPFHLHGHVFWLLGIGVNGTTLDYDKLNTKDPIQRDVTTVPAKGWAVLRFVADNPGVWGFHCHIEWHVQSGLVAQFVELPDKIKKLNPPEDWKALKSKIKEY